MKERNDKQSGNVLSSQFYNEYLDFREKLGLVNLTDKEWSDAFEIKREKTIIRHPEDFEE